MIASFRICKVAHFLVCERAHGHTRPHTPHIQRMVDSRGVGVRVGPCMDPPAVTHCLPHSIYVGTAVSAIVIKGAINHYICAKQGRCCHRDPNDLHCFAYQQKSLQSWQNKGEASTETCQPASVLLSLSFPLSFSHSLLVDVQIALQKSLPQANQDGS